MNRSTGGRVLRERTSVKDGSLFLRLFAQSSCRFSSSIAEERRIQAARCQAKGCSSLLMVGERGLNITLGGNRLCNYIFPCAPCWPRLDFLLRYDLHKGSFPCSERNPYPMLPNRTSFCGNKVSQRLLNYWNIP